MTVAFSNVDLRKRGPSASAAVTLAMIRHATNGNLVPSALVTGEIDLKGNLMGVGALAAKARIALGNNVQLMVVPKDRYDDD